MNLSSEQEVEQEGVYLVKIFLTNSDNSDKD